MPDHSMRHHSMSGEHRRRVSDRYVGRRRARAPGRRHRARREVAAVPRRMTLVVAAVAAVLLGTGALAKTLPFRPILLPTGVGEPAVAPERPSVAEPPATAPAITPEIGTAVTPPPSASVAVAEVPGSPAPSATVVPLSPDPVEPPATAPPVQEPVTFVYEAEDAELSGFVRRFDMDEASGGGVIGEIGLDPSNHVRFPAVTVDTAGAYELTLYYVSAPERLAMVSINDGAMITVDFAGLGDGRTVGSVSIVVELAAGPNAIWFGNPTDPAPALDRITVTG